MKERILNFIKQFALAILFTGVAVLIRVLFFQGLGRGIPYLTFYPAVALVALYGAYVSGFLVVLFSFFLTYSWIQQGHLSNLELLAEGIFVLSGIMISFVGGMRNSSKHVAAVLKKELEIRTKELVERNKKLAAEVRAREEVAKKVLASDQELQQRTLVLEKTNKLMVGRELEMVKLKQQIKGGATVKQNGSKERYESLFMAAKDAIMTLEPPSWTFTSGNPATLAMFGATNEAQFISYEPWRLSPERQPDGRLSSEVAKEKILQAMHDGSCQFEWVHKRTNGEEFFAEVLLSKVGQGDSAFLHATVRDIMEQKNTVESLERFNELMVGRELEMKKLKEQIRELKKKTKTVEKS